jgi:hypothetical protein
MGPWLLHVLGLDNASGVPYLAWSGFGGDVGELAIVAALIATIRRHNCHVHRCWRVGRHPVSTTGYVVCRRHHPEGAPSAADIREAMGNERSE